MGEGDLGWSEDHFQHEHLLTHFPFPKIPSRIGTGNWNWNWKLETSLETKPLFNLIQQPQVLQVTLSSWDSFGWTLDSISRTLDSFGGILDSIGGILDSRDGNWSGDSSWKGRNVDWSWICCSFSRDVSLTKLLWLVPVSRGQDRPCATTEGTQARLRFAGWTELPGKTWINGSVILHFQPELGQMMASFKAQIKQSLGLLVNYGMFGSVAGKSFPSLV